MNIIFFLLLAVVLLFVAGWLLVGLATLLVYAIIGFLIGMVARLLVKDTAGLGVIRTTLAGLAGAVGGGLLADLADVGGVIEWIIVVLVAAIVVAIFSGRRS